MGSMDKYSIGLKIINIGRSRGGTLPYKISKGNKTKSVTPKSKQQVCCPCKYCWEWSLGFLKRSTHCCKLNMASTVCWSSEKKKKKLINWSDSIFETISVTSLDLKQYLYTSSTRCMSNVLLLLFWNGPLALLLHKIRTAKGISNW